MNQDFLNIFLSMQLLLEHMVMKDKTMDENFELQNLVQEAKKLFDNAISSLNLINVPIANTNLLPFIHQFKPMVFNSPDELRFFSASSETSVIKHYLDVSQAVHERHNCKLFYLRCPYSSELESELGQYGFVSSPSQKNMYLNSNGFRGSVYFVEVNHFEEEIAV